MNECHSDDVVWCEDCVHYHAYGIDGEGECNIDGSRTYYGADASICDNFHQREGE